MTEFDFVRELHHRNYKVRTIEMKGPFVQEVRVKLISPRKNLINIKASSYDTVLCELFGEDRKTRPSTSLKGES